MTRRLRQLVMHLVQNKTLNMYHIVEFNLLLSADEYFWLGLSNPGLDSGVSTSDVSPYVVDSHDNSSFKHETYMRNIDLNGNDHCMMMKKSIFNGFAETNNCTKQYKYICQIRIG